MGILTINSKNGTFDFLLDDEDDELITNYNWSVSFFRNGKPRAEFRNKDRKLIRLHRLLMKVTDPAIKVDHIDGNTLNNCKSNLRLATNAENLRNRGKTKSNTSGYKGVTWNKSRKKWVAQIKINYKNIGLGYYDTKEEAAEVYKKAAKQYHKEFAKT